MELLHIATPKPKGDGFYRTDWALIQDRKVVYEFTFEYASVQNPAISFMQALRRKAIQKAHDLGYCTAPEDLVIGGDAPYVEEPVDMIRLAASLMGVK